MTEIASPFLEPASLDMLYELSKSDHAHFVGSDIRQLIGEIRRLRCVDQGYNATQREMEILELRKLASHWKERHDEVLQKHIECCGLDQAAGGCGDEIEDLRGDAATLRGFIREFEMTPSMMASERDHWRQRALKAEGAGEPAQVPRQPTEAMLNAARDWSHEKYGKPIGNDGAIGCWQAMFDASLVPSTDSGGEA